MKARRIAFVLAAALAVYLVLMVGRAVELIKLGTALGITFGATILVLPLLGAGMVVAELRFGMQTERLGRQLAESDRLLDSSDLPRRPSGRIERAAADAWFAERQAEVEANPEDWGAWFRLADAYDMAGDRRRARETMRRAIDLERAATPPH